MADAAAAPACCDGRCAERARADGLQAALERTRRENATNLARLEEEEEGMVNRLLQRVDELKRQQATLQMEVDREEEFISNTLQKQLSGLMREKLQLEAELKHEHQEHAQALKRLTEAFNERMAERNKLQSERCLLENQLEQEQERIINQMTGQIQALLREHAKLKRDNERLRGQLRSLGVSRSVSPALSRGHPSPASSPRHPLQRGFKEDVPAAPLAAGPAQPQ